MLTRISLFAGTALIVILLMLFAILKSKQLSDVMDVLSDDQKSLQTRLSTIGIAWKRNHR
jgi:hypothetical protein